MRFDKLTNKLWTSIEDTGVGIDLKIKKNLFIAFRSATNESSKFMKNKSDNSGIGIGLSKSKSLVQALAGEIDLQSKYDMGTIVQFSIDIVL